MMGAGSEDGALASLGPSYRRSSDPARISGCDPHRWRARLARREARRRFLSRRAKARANAAVLSELWERDRFYRRGEHLERSLPPRRRWDVDRVSDALHHALLL